MSQETITREKQVDKTPANLQKCICMSCPSYSAECKTKSLPGVMSAAKSDLSKQNHLEAMFCGFEKSSCFDTPKGCVCGNCSLHQEYDLHRGFYCMKTGGE